MSLSPAERYAGRANNDANLDSWSSRRGSASTSIRSSAPRCAALDEGRSVLVAAPTGAGKTVVAEFAVFLAMQETGDKVFYTTPIKALSNQKYQEFVDEWGADAVGLLTGDTNVNSGARIVVMTTEVLRNMLYADSPLLDRLAYVVMDEVHYLADRFRGAVWEEVIIHLPEEVRLVSLSRHGVERRGVRRLAAGRPRRHRRHRVRRPAGAARAARAREGEAPRPLRLVGAGVDEPREPRTAAPRAARAAVRSRRARPAVGAAATAAGSTSRRSAVAASNGPRSSSCCTASTCCRRSCSSSRAPGATRRCARCSAPASGSPRRPSATRSAASSRRAPGCSATRTLPCSATGSGSKGSSAASRRTTRACCRRSRKSWRSSSS